MDGGATPLLPAAAGVEAFALSKPELIAEARSRWSRRACDTADSVAGAPSTAARSKAGADTRELGAQWGEAGTRPCGKPQSSPNPALPSNTRQSQVMTGSLEHNVGMRVPLPRLLGKPAGAVQKPAGGFRPCSAAAACCPGACRAQALCRLPALLAAGCTRTLEPLLLLVLNICSCPGGGAPHVLDSNPSSKESHSIQRLLDRRALQAGAERTGGTRAAGIDLVHVPSTKGAAGGDRRTRGAEHPAPTSRMASP